MAASVTYAAVLSAREETVLFLSGLLYAERQRRGTRTGRRALGCFAQAVLVLRWFLDGTRVAQLATDNGVGVSTAYRYLHGHCGHPSAARPRARHHLPASPRHARRPGHHRGAGALAGRPGLRGRGANATRPDQETGGRPAHRRPEDSQPHPCPSALSGRTGELAAQDNPSRPYDASAYAPGALAPLSQPPSSCCTTNTTAPPDRRPKITNPNPGRRLNARSPVQTGPVPQRRPAAGP